MQKHSENTQKVAEYLENHPKVTRVNYPGLLSNPQQDLALQQMKACGGLMSFVVPGGIDSVRTVVDSFKLVNSAFLSMAIAQGLTAGITNPLEPAVTSAILAANLIMGHDAYSARWIKAFRAREKVKAVGG
jgi:hypothetical protein